MSYYKMLNKLINKKKIFYSFLWNFENNRVEYAYISLL